MKARAGDAGDHLEVERLGGFAGFGQPGCALRSRGAVALAALAAPDRAAVERLFAAPPGPDSAVNDGFRYRLSRRAGTRVHAIEVDEPQVPAAVRACVKDELA